jgi:uncharacterized membrane protein YtjA (UPF0391 family)
MLFYVIVFFLLAASAAFLGFNVLAGTFAIIAKILAVVFLVLILVTLLRRVLNGRTRPPVV